MPIPAPLALWLKLRECLCLAGSLQESLHSGGEEGDDLHLPVCPYLKITSLPLCLSCVSRLPKVSGELGR